MVSLICQSKKAIPAETERQWWLPGVERQAKWGDVGQRAQTCGWKMSMSWGPSAQHRDYSSQHCIIYLKVAKRVDLKCFHHKKQQ